MATRHATDRLRLVAHPFRFGIQTGPFADPAALREFAKKIEDLGYAELFSSDHIDGGGLNNVDPFLPLLVAAEATSTLRFGPLVLNNEFHNPVLLARTAACTDRRRPCRPMTRGGPCRISIPYTARPPTRGAWPADRGVCGC
jgi:hypothetical protein